jgi:membrane protease YdiL (CAAX protease family)
MNSLSIWDHAFVAVVFVAYPLYSWLTIKKTLEQIKTGGEAQKISAYKYTMANWVVFAICIAVLWIWLQRDFAELGLQSGDWLRNILGLLAAAAVIAMIIIPIRGASRSADGVATLKAQLGDLWTFLPESKREESWFKAVSINAGITEELIFRGFLIWYLMHFLPLVWAAIGATLLFGFAHAYQGLKQIPGIIFVSAIAMGLYVYTQSLLVPVLFHIALDFLQGHYIARIQRNR